MTSSLLTFPRQLTISGDVPGDLLAALGALPDPRRSGWRRHRLGFVLGVLATSFACAGFESFAGAAQWGAAASTGVLLRLGAAPDPLTGAVRALSEATIRRIATRLDVGALDACLASWTAAQLPAREPGDRLVVAVDGNTVRGARVGDTPAPHLLAAATHEGTVVLAQRQVPDKTNEIPMMATLLEDLRAAGHDLSDLIVTADALHTQHATAVLLHQAGAGYVMTVKANQPTLLAAVIEKVTTEAPSPQRTGGRGHGRTEERLVRVAPAKGIDFPGAAQVFADHPPHR